MKKLICTMTLGVLLLIASPTFAYTVNNGDTMTKIANKSNLTLQELSKVNPQIKNLDVIYVGEYVNTIKPTMKIGYSEYEKNLLARLVRAEAESEPYEGKVAVAEVVLNRVESPEFPNTIKDVIYAPGQFQPVSNGEINKPANSDSIKAVNEALTKNRNVGTKPLYFYNPEICTSHWLDNMPTTFVIGHHVFKK
ncbi:cell wall hydrolase [Neobacillus pocheonensis]|uniref:Cell wall hydrolase n=1 Tax=Neobacillus pocheonensis TaxID=363869 RepID=A0ABT0WA35_9BACI|nr:cell wall hydrolase [Neobacillus pocheonensis]